MSLDFSAKLIKLIFSYVFGWLIVSCISTILPNYLIYLLLGIGIFMCCNATQHSQFNQHYKETYLVTWVNLIDVMCATLLINNPELTLLWYVVIPMTLLIKTFYYIFKLSDDLDRIDDKVKLNYFTHGLVCIVIASNMLLGKTFNNMFSDCGMLLQFSSTIATIVHVMKQTK